MTLDKQALVAGLVSTQGKHLRRFLLTRVRNAADILDSFMSHCATRVGDTYLRTPRTTITAFINLLAVLEQNPTANWKDLLGGLEVGADEGGAADLAVDVEGEDEFASFKL